MIKELSISAQDGTTIPAILSQPDDINPRATTILAHGIFSDKDERGRFVRQTEMLNELNFRVVRFDFRGHGEHSLTPFETTIAGMTLDFLTIVEYVFKQFQERIFWVASSFGASVALLYMQTFEPILPERIVLLNPVVDYFTTFVKPHCSEMKELFSETKWKSLSELGYIEPLEGFKLSRIFCSELNMLRPFLSFKQLRIPTRIVHGTADSNVPHDITREYSTQSDFVDFISVDGAEHAFAEPWEEAISFDLIKSWLSKSTGENRTD